MAALAKVCDGEHFCQDGSFLLADSDVKKGRTFNGTIPTYEYKTRTVKRREVYGIATSVLSTPCNGQADLRSYVPRGSDTLAVGVQAWMLMHNVIPHLPLLYTAASDLICSSPEIPEYASPSLPSDLCSGERFQPVSQV